MQNAAFLASKKGLGVVDAVSSALTNATFDKSTTQQVFIQSDDTSVLSAFNSTNYKRVLEIDDTVSDVPKPSVDEIKKFANAVNIVRSSVFTNVDFFLASTTNVVSEMQSANISVHVSVFRNEFMNVAFDFFSDPVIEIATYTAGLGVDGLVTEFPGTASTYLSKY